MEDHKERWMQLCQQASVEQDPKKLLQLVKEINELLEAKQNEITPHTLSRQSRDA